MSGQTKTGHIGCRQHIILQKYIGGLGIAKPHTGNRRIDAGCIRLQLPICRHDDAGANWFSHYHQPFIRQQPFIRLLPGGLGDRFCAAAGDRKANGHAATFAGMATDQTHPSGAMRH